MSLITFTRHHQQTQVEQQHWSSECVVIVVVVVVVVVPYLYLYNGRTISVVKQPQLRWHKQRLETKPETRRPPPTASFYSPTTSYPSGMKKSKVWVPGRYSTSDTSVYDPKVNSLGQLPLRYTTSNAFCCRQTHTVGKKKERALQRQCQYLHWPRDFPAYLNQKENTRIWLKITEN